MNDSFSYMPIALCISSRLQIPRILICKAIKGLFSPTILFNPLNSPFYVRFALLVIS